MTAMASRLIDLSRPIVRGMRVFPGDPEVSIEQAADFVSDGFEVHALRLGSHTGTHVDAPSHTTPEGDAIDAIAVDRLVGSAIVLRATGLDACAVIEPHHVRQGLAAIAASGAAIALVHTGWDAWFDAERALRHPVVSPALADALVDLGVDVLGVDTLNPDPTMQTHAVSLPVHDRFLGSGRLIVENLCGLERIPGDSCHFAALPLRLSGVDGSPVRAVAWVA